MVISNNHAIIVIKRDVKWDLLFVFTLRYKLKNFIDNFRLHQTSQLILSLFQFQSVPLMWGLCAPLACNITEIRQLISKITKGMWINLALLFFCFYFQSHC